MLTRFVRDLYICVVRVCAIKYPFSAIDFVFNMSVGAFGGADVCVCVMVIDINDDYATCILVDCLAVTNMSGGLGVGTAYIVRFRVGRLIRCSHLIVCVCMCYGCAAFNV